MLLLLTPIHKETCDVYKVQRGEIIGVRASGPSWSASSWMIEMRSSPNKKQEERREQ